MLAYAGRGQSEITSVNLTELTSDVIDLASPAIPKRVRIQQQLQDDLPSVAGDEGQIQQVIMNLLTNASDAMSDRAGDLVVRTGVVRADAEMLARAYLGEARAPGLYVFVEVADSGVGIDPAELSRIFDPFFTTKKTTGGTGIGLSNVRQIVEQWGGHIEASNTADHGAQFTLRLPVA